MRLAFADPPYPGQGARHYDGREVNHRLLVAYLMEFDGWALSTNPDSLSYVQSLCPEGTRVGIWVKSGWMSYKPNVNPAYAWEPVLWYGGRKRTREQPTIRDWVAAPPTQGRGVHGAKPEKFCQWIFQLLNAQPDDEFCDVFPGSNAVSRAWRRQHWQSEMVGA